MNEQEFEEEPSRLKIRNYLSFSMYQLTWTILDSSRAVFLFFFYHTVIGLDPLLIFLAIAINTVWGALNDPLIGYLTDRNFKWTRKLGRRFPWLLMGLIPWCFTIILLFIAPDVTGSPWPAFFWLLFSLILYELFITLSDVHGNILRADKFRTEFERRRYSGFFGIFEMIAMVLGTILPPLLLFGPNKGDYIMMAIIVSLMAFLFAVLFLIDGAREDEVIIERYYATDYKRLNFIRGFKEVFTYKNFFGYWLTWAGWGVATSLLIGMIVYVAVFLLQQSPTFVMIIMAIFILGAMISVPIWLRILKKVVDSKKTYLIGSIALTLSLGPLTFFQTMIDMIILVFIAGFSMGCAWTILTPIIAANLQDDFVVKTQRNQKGILIGGLAVLCTFVAFIDDLLIATVFTLTGFDPGLEDYAALVASGADVGLVQIGIRLLVGIIPMSAMILSTIAFWRIYDLTHEKVLENKRKLKELGF